MSTLSQIRTAFKTVLEANISGLTVYNTVPDVTQVPSVVVMPMACDYMIGMGSCQSWNVGLFVLCPRTESRLGQDQLDAYLSRSGTNSIPVVLRANPTLGLADLNVTLRKMSDYGGQWDAARISHVGAMLHVDALVTM